MNIALESDQWVLLNKNGAVLSSKLVFNSDGTISNWSDFRDFYWVLEDDELIIESIHHATTSTFLYDAEDKQFHGLFFGQSHLQLELIPREIFLKKHTGSLFNRLCNTTWRFRTTRGQINGNLTLGSDGFIKDYPSNNEYRWGTYNNELHFYSVNGQVTSNFGEPKENKKGEIFFTGNYVVDGAPVGIHSLEPLVNKNFEPISSLHSNLCLSKKSETLFVSFNSLANPYDGMDSRWYFHNVPYELGLDYARFSESSPPFWYINKTQDILNILRPQIGHYSNVVMCGVSMGAFAAIWFSESLAREFKNVNFKTFVIQPQTSVTDHDRAYVEATYPAPLSAPCVSSLALSTRDTDLLDLKDFFETELDNVQHTVYYDSGNQSESFYCNKLRSPRTDLVGFNLQQNHTEGCGTLFHQNLVQNAISDLRLF